MRVEYEILDLDKHMDSSEMTPAEWNTIATLVSDNWDRYQGFIILSGTDTLAYTASILTFLFTHPGKPILVTGAQIPLSQPRSDGWSNLLDSLYVAGVLNFAGVGVVFNHQVFQGCRATKASANLFNAFSTPCVPPLINLNVKISEWFLRRLYHAYSPLTSPLSARTNPSPNPGPSRPIINPPTTPNPLDHHTDRDLGPDPPRHHGPSPLCADRGGAHLSRCYSLRVR